MNASENETKPPPVYVNAKFYRDAEKAGWDVSRFRIVQPIPLATRPTPPETHHERE